MYGVPCRYCGDIMDPGEKCYCIYRENKYDSITSLEKTGQMVFDLNLKTKKRTCSVTRFFFITLNRIT